MLFMAHTRSGAADGSEGEGVTPQGATSTANRAELGPRHPISFRATAPTAIAGRLP